MTKITDDYGRIAYDSDDLCKLLMQGRDISNINSFGPEIEYFNALCEVFDRPDDKMNLLEEITVTPEEYHKSLQNEWFIAEPFKSLDIKGLLLGIASELPNSEAAIERVQLELAEFESRNCIQVLNFLLYLVSIVEDNNIVMGVGRGSSIACYCLYLLGVHMIDSLSWNLDPYEFFKSINIEEIPNLENNND